MRFFSARFLVVASLAQSPRPLTAFQAFTFAASGKVNQSLHLPSGLSVSGSPIINPSGPENEQNDLLSRGDARGAAVLLEGVSVARGSVQVLQEINWRVEPQSKWAIIGTNGAGYVIRLSC